ncbi:MAG TPA: mycothiol system anti-sigma-R factor [Pseudonocardiaceae bacterium]|nr:mycothiol system anti-sigma-R factor [Pseudonocardiaceae bacterium]
MSCGKPHEIDCSQVLAEVWLLLDHECSGDQRSKLEQHLDECGPCLEQYGLEEHLKELLARKCGGEHAPDGLKAKLRASIRQVVVQQGGVAVEVQETTTTIQVTDENA